MIFFFFFTFVLSSHPDSSLVPLPSAGSVRRTETLKRRWRHGEPTARPATTHLQKKINCVTKIYIREFLREMTHSQEMTLMEIQQKDF